MGPLNRIETLIVDDSAAMRKAIRDALLTVPACAIVGEAPDGLEALVLARALRPSLVVMDIRMPHMGGLEVLRLLKGDLPEAHVVMVSTFVEPEIRDKVVKLGADACLEKGPELWSRLTAIVSKLSQDLSGRAGQHL